MYTVSRKTVSTFVFWISRLPRALKIPSWTFFKSPFCVDLKNIQFFIIWWTLDWYIRQILQGGHFKSKHFSFIVLSTMSALMSSHDFLWVLISTHQWSWALLSTLEHSWVWCYCAHCAHGLLVPYPWLLLSSHEYSLIHETELISVHGYS